MEESLLVAQNWHAAMHSLAEVTEQHTSTALIRKYPHWQGAVKAALNESN
jgi:hypothetical protein